jgi:hypothetical protein
MLTHSLLNPFQIEKENYQLSAPKESAKGRGCINHSDVGRAKSPKEEFK